MSCVLRRGCQQAFAGQELSKCDTADPASSFEKEVSTGNKASLLFLLTTAKGIVVRHS